jgi:FdhE protein
MIPNQRKAAFLDDISAKAPEYGEVFALFRGIFFYADSRQGETGISFAPDMTHREERIQGGFPLLNAEAMNVDIPRAVAFLIGLLDVAKEKSRDGEAELKRIVDALAEGKLDLPVLFAACLQRDRSKIEAAAETCAVQAALLEFALETVLKTALEPFAAQLTDMDFEGWQEGYCPVCGSRAGMGELVGDEGRRHLSCCTCFFKWPYKRLQCPYCGNDDTETLSYFMVDEGPTRVDVCRKCSRYLKTRDSRKGHADVPLEVEDLATIHLDLVAGREGFERGK